MGSPIRTNIGKSYRLGLELSAALKPTPHWRYRANLSLSRNRNQNAVEARGDGSKNLSYTTLSFSPSVVSSSVLDYKPLEHLTLSWYSKYVGAQYLANAEPKNGRLKPFWNQDFRAAFSSEKWGLKPILLSFLLNNFLNVRYESNGAFYDYDGVPYYYPQAGTNFLIGLILRMGDAQLSDTKNLLCY